MTSEKRTAAARRRQWPGRTPDLTKTPAKVTATLDADGFRWQLWEYEPLPRDDPKNLENGGDWTNHKLIAIPSRQGKGNFSFGFNHFEKRFRACSDITVLEKTEPAVFAWVMSWVCEFKEPANFDDLLGL